MDCVSADGDAFIGYAATLRLGAFLLHYSSALHCRRDQPAKVATSLLKYSTPVINAASSIRWSAHQLGIEGNWTADAPSVERKLFESDAGAVTWQCLQPRAECRIQFGKNERLTGLGYVEHLDLSVPPWQLPIDELRWGRFLSDSEAVAWIDWRGEAPLRLVIHNGAQVDDASIEDHDLLLHGGRTRLALEEHQVLREGPLIRTALSMIPGIKKMVPSRILQTCECKWLSRGSLRDRQTEPSDGWAIHEVVRFA